MRGKNGKLMRVDIEFNNLAREIAKKNNISVKQATKEIAVATRLSGKKRLRKRKIEEVWF